MVLSGVACLLALLSAAPGPAPATTSSGYPEARPGSRFEFPRDHGSHPDFRTEWWYFTGRVLDPAGRPFGFKLTFFRNRSSPPGALAGAGIASPLLAEQIHVAHFAVSDFRERKLHSAQRIGREGFAQAAASTRTFDVHNHGWRGALGADGKLRIEASDGEGDARLSIRLELEATKPVVSHGREGAHQKADDPLEVSHYLSFTRLAARGSLAVQGQSFAVAGEAWMDHEWGSSGAGMIERGWDWFGLALSSGEELMIYQLRRADGSANPVYQGSLVDREGRVEALGPADYHIEATGDWLSPHTGARYPMGWRIVLPRHAGELSIEPAFADQEMLMARSTGISYWEGAVRVAGRFRGAAVKGHGYTELVGYATAAPAAGD